MSRWKFPQRAGGKVSEGMFIAAIIGTTIVILTVFYAVILFIACIIDQHKWEHEHDYDDDSDGRV